jgi:2,3-bisphosphoglycerate-dependent phosphoglycerate mutase
MRLYLIRHAESSNNVAYGSDDYHRFHISDPEITETGHRQAQLLARHLARPGSETCQRPEDNGSAKDYGLTHIYCSLMTRSILTACYIGEAFGIRPLALADVFERKGVYKVDDKGREVGVEGPARGYFEDRFPDLVLPGALDGNGWWNRPVESDRDFLARVKKSLERIIERHGESSDSIGLVSHGDYIDQCINELMGVDRLPPNYENPWEANWVTHNTSVSRVDLLNRSRNIIYLNRIDHLTIPFVTL